ncbi:C6 zinc finger domain-containing protein, partial [Colletotrichum incanum]
LSLSQHTGDLNFLDLELLHHYCNFTAQTLSESPLLRDFWRVNVVKLGLQCDYVMRSILSLSALDLAHQNPERKDSLLETSIFHHDISSRTAIGLMENIQDDNKAELFIFSVLTVYIVLANSQYLQAAPFASVSYSPDWIMLFCGTRHFIKDLSDKPLILPIVTRTIAYFQRRERPYQHTLLKDLKTNINASERDARLLAIYNHAMDELHASYGVFCECFECSEPQDVIEVFVWIAMVADNFLPLLQESRQNAVVIFLYFCLLLRHLRSEWWLDSWVNDLYVKTYQMLDEEHRTWVGDPMMQANDNFLQ